MPHWTDDFEHPSVTDENRGEFNTHMAKFTTQADAVADGYGLAKMKGKPANLPESMEGFADDTARTEFRASANRLLGITHAQNIEDLADLDLKLGSTSDAAMDDKLAAAFKQFVVDEKLSKGDAQKMVGFHNKSMAVARETIATAAKAAEDEAAAKFISDKRACNDALVAHADFTNQETLDKQNVLLHRALKDNAGISVEEADSMAVLLSDGEGATNPVLRRLLLRAYAPMAAESSTEAGDGKPVSKITISEGEQKKEAEVKKVLHWK